jgi:hypothetical protein
MGNSLIKVILIVTLLNFSVISVIRFFPKVYIFAMFIWNHLKRRVFCVYERVIFLVVQSEGSLIHS